MFNRIAKKIIGTVVAASLLIGGGTYYVSTLPTVAPTVMVKVGTGLGSGVHIGDGRILTAAHVVTVNKTVTIKMQDGTSVEGTVIWTDTERDLAMIQVEDYDNLRERNLSCSVPRVEAPITAIGNPLGMEFIKTKGHVAGSVRRVGPWAEVIVTDITILPGNSGGPIINNRGEVIGIVVGMRLFMQGGTGLTFAVPGDSICKSIEEHDAR